jgi:hypothetical protein
MNYLPSEVDLSTGDLVYTSPTSATFPGEILLGRVMAINPRDPFLTSQSVEVRPAADAAALSHVMVLRPAGALGWGSVSAEPVPLVAKPMNAKSLSKGAADGVVPASPPTNAKAHPKKIGVPTAAPQVKKSSGTSPSAGISPQADVDEAVEGL